ncbi:MAG: hypothetical protein ACREEI_11375 [Stellaceae bacterium]
MKMVRSYVTRCLGRLSEVAYNSMNILPPQEQVYRHLFLRDIARAGVEDDFYPVSGAANFSLLYLLARSFAELPISQVVEFGAGQSTVLIDRLASRWQEPVVVTTFEQDAYWAAAIGQKVRHPIVYAPLVRTTVGDRTVAFYDPTRFADLARPDLVLIDGPTAYTVSSRYDRVGSVNFLTTRLADEFAVIFDDGERGGEAEAAGRFRAWLEGRGIQFYENTVRAAKQQRIFCTEKFRAAAYF